MTRVASIERAQARSRRLYKSVAFQRAYVAGARSALDGRSRETCPYRADGKGTWRRTWRRAWLRGHDSVRAS